MISSSYSMSRHLIRIAFVGLFLSCVALPVSARAASCALQSDLATLKNMAESQDRDTLTAIRNEATARKSILAKVLGCAQDEAREIRSRIEMSNPANEEMRRVRTRIIEALDETLAYYDRKRVAAPDLGIRATQEMAKAVRAWRTQTYAPLTQHTYNYLLWLKNDEILGTAGNRLSQVGQMMTAVKANENESFTSLYNEAQKELEQAKVFHRRAKDSLVKLEASDDETIFIKSTLEHLSLMYKDLFSLSEALKKNISR